MSLTHYLRKFTHLRTDRVHGIAPHKPVLLIAILDSIERGTITDNHIVITPELVATFMEVWAMLVKAETFKPRFALPFFHLRSEGFWKLMPFPGMEPAMTSSRSIRSFTNLKETVAWAEIDADLFEFMNEPESREVLRSALLETYFPLTKEIYRQQRTHEGEFMQQLENEVLEKSVADKVEVETDKEEEQFLRSGAFRKAVPKAYNYTCAISGMRIIAKGISMVDACHVIPFSISRNDTIENGIALCPNLHRAFDRHLISIDDDYRVLLKTDFIEAENSDYGIKKYEGRELLLPAERKYWPAKENLAWHREYQYRSF